LRSVSPFGELPDLGLELTRLADLRKERDRLLELRHRLLAAAGRGQQVGVALRRAASRGRSPTARPASPRLAARMPKMLYPSLTGVEPGEVALIKLEGPARLKFKTGVMVLYSDEVSFTLMTPEG